MMPFDDLLTQNTFSHADLIRMLNAKGDDEFLLLKKAKEIRESYIGDKVYLRGLVELSNLCRKDCYYCGIRKGNSHVLRYSVAEQEVLEAARFAEKHGYGSMVLQSGEQLSKVFTDTIAVLVKKIHVETGHKLGITLSLGEQSEETYQKWFDAGAKRYLLRIESSNKELYKKIHPDNNVHSYEKRIEAIKLLRKVGFQVGSGVMIGLPFQTIEHLAEDLLFLQKTDVDMVGMGPYIEHSDTPLFKYKGQLLSPSERFSLSLKMIACLRILMKDINIAATTALQTLHPHGREQALTVGANVIMPNLTPNQYRENYFLYQNKATTKDDAATYHKALEEAIASVGYRIAYNEHGDSKHFDKRK